MAVTLLPRTEFVSAVNQRIEWLAENRTEEQLDAFLAGLSWVRDRIAQAPQGGSLVRKDKHHALRMRLFPRPLPYLVYYAHQQAEPITEVYLVRLYASGQRRPRVTMSSWPW